MEMPERKKAAKGWLILIPILLLAASALFFYKTESLRQARQEEKLLALYEKILPEASEFQRVQVEEANAQALLTDSGYKDIQVKQILEAKNPEGQEVGRIYALSRKASYGGRLTLLVGMNESGDICGIQIQEASELVEALAEKELPSFLDQFLYGRSDKVFWTKEEVFGGTEIASMKGAPAVSRDIVDLVNGSRLLEEHLDQITGGEEHETTKAN